MNGSSSASTIRRRNRAGVGAVDDPVIVRKRQRQHESRLKLAVHELSAPLRARRNRASPSHSRVSRASASLGCGTSRFRHESGPLPQKSPSTYPLSIASRHQTVPVTALYLDVPCDLISGLPASVPAWSPWPPWPPGAMLAWPSALGTTTTAQALGIVTPLPGAAPFDPTLTAISADGLGRARSGLPAPHAPPP